MAQCQHNGEMKTGIFVTASIGIVVYGIHGREREKLIEKADLAMYQAKLEGRDCVRIADMLTMSISTPAIQPSCVSTRHRREHIKKRLLGEEESDKQISVQALQALSAVVQRHD